MNKFAFASSLFLAIGLLFLQACADSTLGTGVLLWSTEEINASPGELVTVIEENNQTNSYLIRLPGEDPFTVARYRIELFASEEEAKQFAEQYDEMAHIYARSRQRALPVRNRPDTDSRAVYRLQEDEVMKVLEIAEQEVSISGLRGHWHRVLTEGGVEGWAFGYSLSVYDIREGELLAAADSDIPSFGREVIETVWRPNDYYELVSSRTPVLEAINANHGLFPEPSESMVHIRTEEVDREFRYTGITSSGSNNIRFQGTDLEIRRDGSNRITVFLTDDGEEYTLRMRSISGSLEEILQDERERRETAIEVFHGEGRLLGSSAYGTIVVDEDGRFTWEDSEELRGSVVPPHYAETGRLEFRYFPASSLRSRYDGVVSFSFDNAPSDERVSFLYEIEPSGIRLTHVPLSQIRDFQVRSDSASSLVIFMNFQETDDASS